MLDTYFNPKALIIYVKENGGDKKYNYAYFTEGFEEWGKDLHITIADTEHLTQYLNESGYKVLEIKEDVK